MDEHHQHTASAAYLQGSCIHREKHHAVILHDYIGMFILEQITLRLSTTNDTISPRNAGRVRVFPRLFTAVTGWTYQARGNLPEAGVATADLGIKHPVTVMNKLGNTLTATHIQTPSVTRADGIIRGAQPQCDLLQNRHPDVVMKDYSIDYESIMLDAFVKAGSPQPSSSASSDGEDRALSDSKSESIEYKG